MSDLNTLIQVAAQHQFNLTGSLSHGDVQALANRWLPEIRFHEQDLFHPITLHDVLDKPPAIFEEAPQSLQEQLLVKLVQFNGVTGAGEIGSFPPPVLSVPDGLVVIPDDVNSILNPGDGPPMAPARRVLNADRPLSAALEDPAVNGDAAITSGKSYFNAKEYFGSRQTLNGGSVSSSDPRLARHPIRIIAELKMLLETLEYELLVEKVPDYPPDGLRSRFDIIPQLFLFNDSPHGPGLTREIKAKILLELIADHRNQVANAVGLARAKLPTGWRLVEPVWQAVTRFAFLEFYLVYAYNDFDQYYIVGNKHEGDIEGCCVVFERAPLESASASGKLPDAVQPWAIITSVHTEKQGHDRFKRLAPAHIDKDLTAWVARGSHATYLGPGRHSLADYPEAVTLLLDWVPSWLLVLAPIIGPVVMLLAILEHFADAEDETSDHGTFTGPPDPGDLPTPSDPRFTPATVLVTPMSRNEGVRNIYSPESDSERFALAVRAFPGKWGGHSGIFHKSSGFENKTGRYFRRLIKYLRLEDPESFNRPEIVATRPPTPDLIG